MGRYDFHFEPNWGRFDLGPIWLEADLNWGRFDWSRFDWKSCRLPGYWFFKRLVKIRKSVISHFRLIKKCEIGKQSYFFTDNLIIGEFNDIAGIEKRFLITTPTILAAKIILTLSMRLSTHWQCMSVKEFEIGLDNHWKHQECKYDFSMDINNKKSFKNKGKKWETLLKILVIYNKFFSFIFPPLFLKFQVTVGGPGCLMS